MKRIKLINFENATDQEASSYRIREASRAVVFDVDGKVALLHSTVNGYYKLPGGGLEKGEDTKRALARECEEEIGCDIEITGELGIIVEYRKRDSLKQVSYCYIAKIKGEKGAPRLEPDEIAEGFEPVWMPLDEAVKVASAAGDPAVYEASYMVARDSTFLEEARIIIGDHFNQ